MPLDYEYQFTRPWLDLYYVRIPAPPPLEYTDSVIVSLPDDVLLQVFRHLDVVSLVRMMSVCRRWSNICAANLLWRPFCLLTWKFDPVDSLEDLHANQFASSWYRMYVERPRLRFDGVYISKNNYVRTGIPEGKSYSAVMIVSYFRYLRFYEDGGVVALTSSERPEKIFKRVRINGKLNGLCAGHYTVVDRTVEVFVPQRLESHPNMKPYSTCMTLRLGSSVKGANNRLKPLSLAVLSDGAGEPHVLDSIPQTFQFISAKALEYRSSLVAAELEAN